MTASAKREGNEGMGRRGRITMVRLRAAPGRLGRRTTWSRGRNEVATEKQRREKSRAVPSRASTSSTMRRTPPRRRWGWGAGETSRRWRKGGGYEPSRWRSGLARPREARERSSTTASYAPTRELLENSPTRR
ncbi:unnamed protein product, partial [Ectocarpus sp. 12 AP-2014]